MKLNAVVSLLVTQDRQPTVAEDGMPICSEECTQHDGKRCRTLGRKPRTICEPAVSDLLQYVENLQDEKSSVIDKRVSISFESPSTVATNLTKDELLVLIYALSDMQHAEAEDWPCRQVLRQYAVDWKALSDKLLDATRKNKAT